MFSAKDLFFTPTAVSSAYQVTKSLRFRSSATAYLSRTPASASNRTVWTWSGWVKRGTLGAYQGLFTSYVSTNDTSVIDFSNTDTIRIQNLVGGVMKADKQTTAVYRDPSAWYHVVVASNGATSLKLYVNGQEVTVFGTNTGPSSDNWQFNSTNPQWIGREQYSTTNYYTDGYLAEVNFIDGQALDSSYFGAYDTNGVWQPKAYSGTYGTNGFYLPFNLSTTSSYAASFNGTNQSLALTANSSLQFGTGDFTVEGWYYQNGTVNYGNIFSTTSSYATTGGIRLSTGPSNNTFEVATASSGLFTASSAFQASAWLHFAVVRSSGTTKLYVNGVSVGSAADTNSYTADTFRIGWVDGTSSSTYLLNGLLSNFRVVKGTAVYTANFTPPSSPLTAISGTSLLTLQNSTIIDNSTNNFSITNNGTVTTATATPFVANVFADASGNNNTWTGNNINYSSSGTTYDSMLDSPTNYADGGNGRGNYAVWNPVNVSGGGTTTITDGNLATSVGSTTTYGKVLGTIGMSTGKWYWEVTITAVGGAANVGIGDGTAPSGSAGLGGVAGEIAYQSSGNKYTNNTGSAYGASYTTNDIIGVAYDADAGSITFYKNNTSQGAVTGFSGTKYPAVGSGGGTNPSYAVNFGQRPFTYTPPSGYSALNTQNITTPTILNGALYMAATTYTSNGSTQTVDNGTNTTIGTSFQPDLLWQKTRNAVNNHYLTNVVSGVSKYLISNLTDAEGTASTYVSSFNSNGFTIGTGNFPNGNTLVAWQWKAGNSAGSSNTSGTITSTVSANQTAGFSVVTYTGTQTSAGNGTIGHGLGVAPSLVISKTRSTTSRWVVQHASLGANEYLELNTTAAAANSSSVGAGTLPKPTSTVFYGSWLQGLNINGDTFVAYCFAPVAGYSSFGSYTGNGSADGPFVYTGFRPRWLMIKGNLVGGWEMYDTSRDTYNLTNHYLHAQSSAAETTVATLELDILSNGFKIKGSGPEINQSGTTFYYAAFAENPFTISRAR